MKPSAIGSEWPARSEWPPECLIPESEIQAERERLQKIPFLRFHFGQLLRRTASLIIRASIRLDAGKRDA